MDGLNDLNEHRYSNLAYRHGELLALAPVDSGGTIRKSIDTDDLTVLSVLTFPCTDLAGDYVDPAGLNFREHIAKPEVDVEHSRSPEFGNLIVAKCQHPDGRYAVDYRNLKLDDGSTHSLPVAKSYFDKDSRASMQVFALVERDILPGVSLEFKAISGHPLGRSPLENRQAYHFDRIDVVRYTHCATPVCPGALTVTKSLDALIPVVQSGKIGAETLDPRLLGVLRKSVATYTPKRVLVAGGFMGKKAMPDQQYDPNAGPDTIYDNMNGGDDDMGMDEGPIGPPTAAAAYKLAQAINDAIDQAEEELSASEHVAGKKKTMKVMENLRSRAIKELIGIGDDVTQDVNGDTMGGMSADDETSEVEDEATDSEDEEETDDDAGDDEESESKPPKKKFGKGIMRAFSNPKRLWVRKSVLAVHKAMQTVRKHKRYRKAEVESAESTPVIQKAVEVDAEAEREARELEEQIETERKAFERAERERKRKQRIYG